MGQSVVNLKTLLQDCKSSVPEKKGQWRIEQKEEENISLRLMKRKGENYPWKNG
jgi:hypothetical protein